MAAPTPQAERKFHVRVVKVIRFSHAPIVIFRGHMNTKNLLSGLKLDIMEPG